LSIPVTVKGTPANLTFLVYTKDKAKSIGKIRNGWLGWHYVNEVDTCLYFSTPYSLEPGNRTITWNGKDQQGSKVPEGEYTYYMWAFDHVSSKTRVSSYSVSWWSNGVDVQEYGEDGKPLVHPFIHQHKPYTKGIKWTIGNDPMDLGLLETTFFDLPEDTRQGRQNGPACFDPKDFNTCYVIYGNTSDKTLGLRKYKWVPNGPAEWESTWGDRWSHGAEWDNTQGVYTDGTYLYMNTCNSFIAEAMGYYTIVDFDGSLVADISMDGWFVKPDEYFRDGGASYLNMYMYGNMRGGKYFLGGYCMWTQTNPQRYLETNELDDLVDWANMNGDFINDMGWEADSPTPWLCFADSAPYIVSWYPDNHHFTDSGVYDLGAVSFALMAPDGTGIGYFSYAGETGAWHGAGMRVQTGSAYDGMYVDNQDAQSADENYGVWFVGCDSIKGVITNKPVEVAENKPAEFAVEQNSPNPFNPTTTISYNVPEANTVNISIYNVAGQKIDTIVNGFMDAGRHSVVWDATSFSAGVYFFTVKSGEYSKTMKMTLLK